MLVPKPFAAFTARAFARRIEEEEQEAEQEGRREVQPGEGFLDPDEIYFLSDPNGRLQKLVSPLAVSARWIMQIGSREVP